MKAVLIVVSFLALSACGSSDETAGEAPTATNAAQRYVIPNTFLQQLADDADRAAFFAGGLSSCSTTAKETIENAGESALPSQIANVCECSVVAAMAGKTTAQIVSGDVNQDRSMCDEWK